MAASEAATERIPGDVAYATDLRVIECSRDASARDQLEETGTPVGATGVDDGAARAGRRGVGAGVAGRRPAARDASGLTIRVEMGRVAKTTLLRGGAVAVGEEQPEVALEQAETAAREALVRAALRGGSPDRDGEHPWDAARNAARASAGGAVWSVVADESRQAVGEAAWAQAMDDARAVVDAVLDDGPDTVARAVAAAVAREACSAAARGRRLPRRRGRARPRRRRRRRAEAAREALATTASELREAGFDAARVDDPREGHELMHAVVTGLRRLRRLDAHRPAAGRAATGCSASTASRPTTTASRSGRTWPARSAHDRFELVEADLRTADLAELLDGADVVFHQAAQPGVRLSWSSGFASTTATTCWRRNGCSKPRSRRAGRGPVLDDRGTAAAVVDTHVKWVLP